MERIIAIAKKIRKIATFSNLKKVFFGERSSMKGKIVKNFIWLFTSNFASRFIRASITIYAARILGAEGYGVFSYVLGLAGFFTFFKNIGLDSILMREVARNPEKRHNYFSTAFWMEIILVIVSILLIVFIAPFFSKIEAAILLFPLAAVVLAFDDLRDFFFGFFRGKEKMELEAIVTIISNISITAFGFFALTYFKTPFSFLASYAMASVFTTVIAAILLKPHVDGIVKNFEPGLVKPILTSALPIAASVLTGVFLFGVDIVMLGWWRTPYEIGLYSAAQKVVGILAIFSGLIGTVTFPALSRLVHTEIDRARGVFESSVKMIFFLSIPFVIGGLALSGSIMKFVFGASFLPAASAFSVLIISILGIHPLVLFTNLIFAFDKQARAVKYVLIASLTNLFVSFLLIPKFGIIGASISVVITFFVYIGLFWKFAKTLMDFEILPKLKKIVISSLCMGILALIFDKFGMYILLNIAISGSFYFVLLYIFRDNSLEQIFSVFRGKI